MSFLDHEWRIAETGWRDETKPRCYDTAMQRTWISCRLLPVAFLASFAACDMSSTEVTPAAALVYHDDMLFVRPEGSELLLAFISDGCRSLTPQVRGLLDGVAGDVHDEAINTDYCEDFGHCDSQCEGPSIHWLGPTPIAGPSSFVVTDDVTTWTMTVDRLFRTVELAPPFAIPFHGGDVITVRVTPAATPINPTVKVIAPTGTLLTANQTSGLTVMGSDLSFTLPAIASATSATIEVVASATPTITACDAPGGCQIDATALDATLPISLAP